MRHALDLKNEAIFRDVKKFDLVNPVIGKLATQVKAIKLTDHELTKKILGQGETDKLQNRFDLFKEGLSDIINKDNDENTGSGGIGGGRGGGDDGTPPRPLPRTYLVETFQLKIQDELRRSMMKDFKIEDLGNEKIYQGE